MIESPTFPDIERELKALGKEKALRIIANTLRHFSDETKTLAVAATWTKGLRTDSQELFILAPSEPGMYPEEDDVLDHCCNEGQCGECRALLWSNFKSVCCPLCGSDAYLS